MSQLADDEALNRRLRHDRPGRQFVANEDSRWGELILPARAENPDKTDQGLRLMFISSLPLGCCAIGTAKTYEQRHPERLNLVGVVTDDASNPVARINKKSTWWFMAPEQRLEVETAIIEAALSHGTPVYTGEVKVDWFRNCAAEWRPDAIMVCGFGQLIDAPIIRLPRLGIYNFHPSDLGHHHGAGISPYDDLAARNAATTVWTVHQVSEEIDAGPIVGASPPICIRTETGELPENTLGVYLKMLEPLGYMVYFLIDALADRCERGETGPLARLDFAGRFPADVKARIMEPIKGDEHPSLVPQPDPAIFDLD